MVILRLKHGLLDLLDGILSGKFENDDGDLRHSAPYRIRIGMTEISVIQHQRC